jgi:hypothetical protein
VRHGAGLAHASDGDATLAAEEQAYGALELGVQILAQVKDPPSLGLQNICGQLQDSG